MKIHHLNCTTMCPTAGRLFPSLVPKELVCHCLMLETDHGLVLVDTGMSHATLNNPSSVGASNYLVGVQKDPEQAAVSQVEQLGFAPQDVRHIIVTHLDDDHCGGIVDFPEAHVHTSQREMEAAKNPTKRTEKLRYRNFNAGPDARWSLHNFAEGENWFGFKSVRALDNNPDVLLIPLMGHSFGHLGIAVRTESGWILHAGDAYYDHRELDGKGQESFGMSLLQTAVHSDYAAAIHNRQKLRELKNTHPEVRIFCAHDAEEFRLFSQKL